MIFQIQQMYVDTVNFCDRLYIHTHRYTINRNNHYSKVEILKAKHIVSEEVILTGGKKISLPERNVLERKGDARGLQTAQLNFSYYA